MLHTHVVDLPSRSRLLKFSLLVPQILNVGVEKNLVNLILVHEIDLVPDTVHKTRLAHLISNVVVS